MPESPCIGAGRYGRDCGALPYTASSINDLNIPDNLMIIETYPNPFNSAIRVKFNLENPSFVKIDIFNMIGQKIAVLHDGYLDSGVYSYLFKPAQDLSSGTYLIRVSCDNRKSHKKIIYLK